MFKENQTVFVNTTQNLGILTERIGSKFFPLRATTMVKKQSNLCKWHFARNIFLTHEDTHMRNKRYANHYENTPIQIFWKFHHQKLKVFR